MLIAISFYRNENLVAAVLGSLIDNAADVRAVQGEVVLYDDSPDYPPLAAELAAHLPRAAALFPCRIVTNPGNLGFVKTMNFAVAEAVARRHDLLLLNSDTRVEAGALPEMARVASLDPMIGFVNPRSDNATITTLPIEDRIADRHAAYRALAARLPRFTYVPTGVGFCLWINWAILAEFGGFDEIYGAGYNEENDLVMRAGRCGYRAVLANHAFVWHDGETSFSTAAVDRNALEPINRAILDARYPEYAGFTLAHYELPETAAERLLAQLWPDATGKLDLALDFSSFRPDHNGTFQAGKQLLQAAMLDWRDRFNIHVLCSAEVYEYHGYAALGAPRADPGKDTRFAVIFRVGQPYDWNVLQRLAMTGAVIGIYMLDTISIDCPQLTSPTLYNIWQFTLHHLDMVAAQSRQTQAALRFRFDIPSEVTQILSMHSLDLADYRLPVTALPGGLDFGDRPMILVLGNHFPHKYLAPTANALAEALPETTIFALGQIRSARPSPVANPLLPTELSDAANLIGWRAGKLGDGELGALYARASVLVFPTHYEGFGFPALNALAAGKPVFLRRLPVFLELHEQLGNTPNMHFYDTTAELAARLRTPPSWIDAADPDRVPHDASRSADEIRQGLETALGRITHDRIVARIRAVQFASDIAKHPVGAAVAPDDMPARAAHFIAGGIERVIASAFRFPPAYAGARAIFWTARRLRSRLQGKRSQT